MCVLHTLITRMLLYWRGFSLHHFLCGELLTLLLLATRRFLGRTNPETRLLHYASVFKELFHSYQSKTSVSFYIRKPARVLLVPRGFRVVIALYVWCLTGNSFLGLFCVISLL